MTVSAPALKRQFQGLYALVLQIGKSRKAKRVIEEKEDDDALESNSDEDEPLSTSQTEFEQRVLRAYASVIMSRNFGQKL